MQYSSHQVSKMDYARYIAASLFYLTTQTQRDAAGLIVFDDELRDYVRPSTRAGQLQRLLSSLEHAEPRARTDFAKPIHHFRHFLRRRGIVLVVSDFYEPPEQVVKALAPLRLHGNEVLLFHVLDPAEIRPDISEVTALFDLETEEILEVSAEYVRNDYATRIDTHIETLRDLAHGAGMDYYLLRTDRPLDGALREYLSIRQGRL